MIELIKIAARLVFFSLALVQKNNNKVFDFNVHLIVRGIESFAKWRV